MRLAKRFWRAPRAGLTAARVLSAYRHAQEDLRTSSEVADIARAQIDHAAARTGVAAGEVRALVEEWMEVRPLDAIVSAARPGLLATLDTLREQGIRLAVVSDYPAIGKLDALGIGDRFDAIVSADDSRVQAFKPHPNGLAVALDELGLHASEALYVGDRAEVDGLAAAAAGLSCVLIGEPQRRRSHGAGVWITDLEQVIDIVRSQS